MDEQELNALIEASKKVHEEIKRKLEWVKKYPLEAAELILELEEKLKIK